MRRAVGFRDQYARARGRRAAVGAGVFNLKRSLSSGESPSQPRSDCTYVGYARPIGSQRLFD